MSADDTIGLIADSARAYVAASQSVGRARKWLERSAEATFDWQALAEAGWCAMLGPEEAGGGFGLAEAAALHTALGGGLLPEPLALTAHLPMLIARGCVVHGAQIASEIGAGTPMAVAWQSTAGTLSSEGCAVQYQNGALNGSATNVVGFSHERDMLVVARSADGVGIYRVSAARITAKEIVWADGTRAHDLTFAEVPITTDACVMTSGGDAVVDDALDQVRLILSAELLGIARATFERTLDYMKTRKQFGRAIGSFQALQHRAADLHVQVELTDAAVQLALEQFAATDDAHVRASAASAVKARASNTAWLVAREAIQLHGAIAYTMEHDIGLFVAKAMTLAAQLGNARQHRQRYAQLMAGSLAA